MSGNTCCRLVGHQNPAVTRLNSLTRKPDVLQKRAQDWGWTHFSLNQCHIGALNPPVLNLLNLLKTNAGTIPKNLLIHCSPINFLFKNYQKVGAQNIGP